MNPNAFFPVSEQKSTLQNDPPARQATERSGSLLEPRAACRGKWSKISRFAGRLCGLLALTAIVMGSAASASVLYVSETMTFNSRGTMEGASYNSLGSRGVFFTTGPSGPYTINLLDTVFMTDTGVAAGDTFTFNLDVRNVSGGLPGTTLFATDTVTWQSTSAPATEQNVNLRQADLPNISSYAFQSNTAYSLVLYGMEYLGSPNNKVAMMRNTTLAAASTVSYTDGFSNAGFFQNNFTYAGSHSISIGTVPEPSTLALIGFGALALCRRNARRQHD